MNNDGKLSSFEKIMYMYVLSSPSENCQEPLRTNFKIKEGSKLSSRSQFLACCVLVLKAITGSTPQNIFNFYICNH